MSLFFCNFAADFVMDVKKPFATAKVLLIFEIYK